MSIAPLVAQQMALTSRKSDVELLITFISQRQQALMLKSGTMMEQYLLKAQQKADNAQADDAAANVETFNSDEFYAEYELASNRLQLQEKSLEMEKKNKEALHKSISTSLQSIEKLIKKNSSKEYNTSLG